MLKYVYLIIGFIALIQGANIFVDGSASLAKLLKVPSIIIGLTVVAFGTSAPEAAISITAAIKGSNGIAIGNVIGSNIFNLLAVLGTSALISPIVIKKQQIKFDYVFSGIITLVLIIMVYIGRDISRIEGFILVLMLAYYLWYMISNTWKKRNTESNEVKTMPPVKAFIFIILGIFCIITGGNLVVSSASQIARDFGLSESFIGLTIVAIGTSLPELVTSFAAARKGDNGIAVGNVIGSNILNISFVLGMTGCISPIMADIYASYDILAVLICTLLIWFLIGKDEKLGKKEGFLMLSLYIAYMVYIVLR